MSQEDITPSHPPEINKLLLELIPFLTEEGVNIQRHFTKSFTLVLSGRIKPEYEENVSKIIKQIPNGKIFFYEVKENYIEFSAYI